MHSSRPSSGRAPSPRHFCSHITGVSNRRRIVMRTSHWLLIFVCLATMPLSAGDRHLRSQLASLPVAARADISNVLGRNTPQYQLRVQGGRVRGENTEQGFTTEFSADGIAVRSGGAAWKIALHAYGHGSRLNLVTTTKPQVNLNRLEYRRGPRLE